MGNIKFSDRYREKSKIEIEEWKRDRITRYSGINYDGKRITLLLNKTNVIFINTSLKPSKLTPVWGSKFESVGIVKELVPNGDTLVSWGNGQEIYTSIKNLDVYEGHPSSRAEPGPNQAFKQGKRRGDIPDALADQKESLWGEVSDFFASAEAVAGNVVAGTAIHEEMIEVNTLTTTPDDEPDEAPEESRPLTSDSYSDDDYFFIG